eukprot:361174-Chlamydomonas_euryale.AAC.8
MRGPERVAGRVAERVAKTLYPYVKPRQGCPCTEHSSRPQVEAYHACRGRGQPETEDMHARKCLRPEAEGHLHAYMSKAKGRPRPRPA